MWDVGWHLAGGDQRLDSSGSDADLCRLSRDLDLTLLAGGVVVVYLDAGARSQPNGRYVGATCAQQSADVGDGQRQSIPDHASRESSARDGWVVQGSDWRVGRWWARAATRVALRA